MSLVDPPTEAIPSIAKHLRRPVPQKFEYKKSEKSEVNMLGLLYFFKVDVQLVRDCFVFQLPCFMLVLVSSRSTRICSIPCMWGFSALPFQNLDGVTATGRRRFFWGNSSGRDPGSEEDKRKEAFLKAIACEPQSTRFPQKLQSCKLLSLPCV